MVFNIRRIIETFEGPLEEMSRSEFVNQCRLFFREFSKKYWLEHLGKYPEPEYAMRGHEHEGGLYSPLRNVITVNPDAANDPKSFRSVFCHELIHYYDAMLHGEKSDKQDKGHGPYFNAMMLEVNRREGFELVLKNWKADQFGVANKPFMVYVVPYKDGFVAFQSAKKTNDAIRALVWLGFIHKAKIFAGVSTSGILHRLPVYRKSGGRISYSMFSPGKPGYEDVLAIAIPENEVDPAAVPKASEEPLKPYWLYLGCIDAYNPAEKRRYFYFWSGKRDLQLMVKMKEILDRFSERSPVSTIATQAWIIETDDPQFKKSVRNPMSSSSGLTFGRNYNYSYPYEFDALQKVASNLRAQDEVDIDAILDEEPPFVVYVFSKGPGGNTVAYWSDRPDDRVARSVAKYYSYDTIRRIDNPNPILKKFLGKAAFGANRGMSVTMIRQGSPVEKLLVSGSAETVDSYRSAAVPT